MVTAATVAIGVPEFGVETSAEIDGQLFVVLSALTEGESFDTVMSEGGDHGFESWRKLHGRWNPYTAGRARRLLREILSPTRAKLPELTCAIENMEDLVRRYSSRRDAQGNAHNLAEDIRMSSLEALLPDDFLKHVQLNRARLTSYGVLREEIKTYCECRGHANAQNTKQKVHHIQEETTQWTLVHMAKARANKAKARTARVKAKAKAKASKDSTDRTRTSAWTRARIRLNVGIVEDVDTTRKTVGARRTPTKVIRRENTNPLMQMLTILIRNHKLLNQKSQSMNSA